MWEIIGYVVAGILVLYMVAPIVYGVIAGITALITGLRDLKRGDGDPRPYRDLPRTEAEWDKFDFDELDN